MMRFKAVSRWLLVGVLLVGLVSTLATVGLAQGKKSILDKVLERGVVRVGMILTLPPVASRDESGKPVGFEPDIARILADTLGVKLEIVELTGPSRVPAVAAGKVDVAIADFTRTLERAKTITFCEVPYMLVGVTFLLPKDSPYNTYKDLVKAGSSLTIGISRGGTSEQTIPKLLPQANIKRFGEHADEFLALRTGAVDVISEDSIVVFTQAKLHPDLYKTTGGVYSREAICAAIPHGDPVWLNWLNLFFHELNASGKTKELYIKWFGTEPPPIPSWVSGG